MIALVDIGNSRFKYALCSIPAFQIDTLSTKDLNEDYLGEIKSFENASLNDEWLDKHFSLISKIVIASVTSDNVNNSVKQWARSRGIELIWVETERAFARVTNGYEDYQQLGVDRWLALIGAKFLKPKEHCLIIDSGTATTIDLLDKSGHHLGGWILPGIDLMSSSVLTSTARVCGSPVAENPLGFGRNTGENLYLASWGATIGAVERAMTLSAQELNEPPTLLFTGGNGKALADQVTKLQTKISVEVVEKLIFVGLMRYLVQ